MLLLDNEAGFRKFISVKTTKLILLDSLLQESGVVWAKVFEKKGEQNGG